MVAMGVAVVLVFVGAWPFPELETGAEAVLASADSAAAFATEATSCATWDSVK